MRECITIVEMESFTKERPRTNFKTGAIYTPTKTMQNERRIAQQFRIQNRQWEITDLPIAVDIEIETSVPVNSNKKTKIAMLEGEIYPIKKPDVDNVSKLVLDALQGVAYEDDYQVITLRVTKKYGPSKKLTIKIEKI